LAIERGTLIAGRYRVEAPLGKGGMGEVFSAENTRTGRRVAVKVLRAEAKDKTTAIERFRREARAAGAITSEFVTQVFDVEDDAEHGIVIVFELLEGESLVERLKRTGPIEMVELWGIVEAVWVGLADAHAAGIIHRDLKPSNVFLEAKNGPLKVKILDFGISKLPKEFTEHSLTQVGQSLGTFSFMPPEQIGKAKTVDHRADIYACATLIYQALTGKLPFQAKNAVVMMELKLRQNALSLADALGKPVEPSLEAFVAKGLARSPEDRFQTAVEALKAWRELRPAGAPSIVVGAGSRPTNREVDEDPHTIQARPAQTPAAAPLAPQEPSGARAVGAPAPRLVTSAPPIAAPPNAPDAAQASSDDEASVSEEAATLLRRPPELEALLAKVAEGRLKAAAAAAPASAPISAPTSHDSVAVSFSDPGTSTTTAKGVTKLVLGAIALMLLGFALVALAARLVR
jgi:hypothetical protein